MSTNVLETRNLTKQYGTSLALHNVSMSINAGEIYGLVGENGAGKTTLMNIICGLAKPSSGAISLFGNTQKATLNLARKKIGVLIEAPALYPELNAHENLLFYSKIYGINNKNKIQQVLQAVALTDTGKKPAADFSLGMRQRLGLAITLLNDPHLLILDEPINGLDPLGIVEIRNILEQLSKNGVAILISSHILSELQLLATKIGFIHKGHLIKEIDAINLSTPNLEHYYMNLIGGIDK